MKSDIYLSSKLNSLGLSLNLLSRKSGVAYSTVYNVFTGRKSVADMSSGCLKRLADALDMSMGDLYSALSAPYPKQAYISASGQLSDSVPEQSSCSTPELLSKPIQAVLPTSQPVSGSVSGSVQITPGPGTIKSREYPESVQITPPLPDFSLMWKNKVTADIHIEGAEVLIERYDTDPCRQLFYADRMPLFKFGEIAKSRCWDEHRSDIDVLLHYIGLDTFNQYSIIRITHGLMCQDHIWFRFNGEKLSYNDIRRIAFVKRNNT